MARYAKREVRADQKTQPAPTRQRLKGASGAARVAMTIALAALLCAPLAACKDTDVLTELIYDPTSDNIDYSNPLKHWVNVSGAPEANREENILSEAQTQAMLEQSLAEYGQDATEPEQVAQQNVTGSTQQDKQASTGEQQGESANGTNASNSESDKQASSGNGSGNGSSAQQNDENSLLEDSQSSEDNSGSKATGGAGGTGRVYGESEYSELPRGQRIAATGDYALITMMLAGGGDGFAPALVAADEEFLSGKAASAFADEEIGTVRAVWSGDGSQEGQLNLQALIAAEPDIVLIGTDESSMTQEEADALQLEGIQIVIMPEMGTTTADDSDIKSSVQIVGEVLRGSYTRYDAPAMADEWVSFHNSVLQEVLDRNGGFAGSFDPLQSTVRAEYIAGIGIDGASAWVGKSYGLSSNYYMTQYFDDWLQNTVASQVVGSRRYRTNDGPKTLDNVPIDVSDGVGVTEYTNNPQWTSGTQSNIAFYLQCAGFDTNIGGTTPAVTSEGQSEALVDLGYGSNPFQLSDWITVSGYPFTSHVASTTLLGPFGCGPANKYRPVVDANSDYYPGIVVRNSAMMESIVSSSRKINGAWRSYGSKDGSQSIQYEVYVLPAGIGGSWADGTPESFLVSPWMYCTVQEGKNYSMCSSWLADFYETFFREGYEPFVEGYGTWALAG